MSRASRQAALQSFIQQGLVTSHQRAVALLAAKGFRVTQATVSRDLEDLGAAKVHGRKGARYQLERGSSAFGASLEVVLKEFVIGRAASGNMVVLKTPPGHANVVAAALDRAALSGILGTLAGDDTIFICAQEGIGGRGVLQRLKGILRG